jgi:putative ABC transport system permease protein
MGIPLQQGRHFNSGDTGQSMPVAIVNETMARQYWPGEDAVGKRFKKGDPNDSTVPWVMIVGVVEDVRQMGLDLPVKAEMYFPYQQDAGAPWFAPRDLVIRASVDPMSLVAAVRAEIRSVDPDQPVSNIRTMDEILGEQSAPRVSMTLLVVFATLALLLAAIGIYGVLSYFVAQSTPEIGIRLAMGAQSRDVVSLVLRRGMTLTLLGVGIGLIGSFLLTRLMSTLLYGVSASDPTTFGAIALLLTAVALLACYIPARRAARVDPMIALRSE